MVTLKILQGYASGVREWRLGEVPGGPCLHSSSENISNESLSVNDECSAIMVGSRLGGGTPSVLHGAV